MEPDEARAADTAAWIARADVDLRSAEHALTAWRPLREDAVFHCQQAAEKAMKALLTWHDVPSRRTHSLEELGRQCVAIDGALELLVNEAAPLSEYAWKFRYPGDDEPPTLDETDRALQIARAVFTAVLDRLPAQIYPETR